MQCSILLGFSERWVWIENGRGLGEKVKVKLCSNRSLNVARKYHVGKILRRLSCVSGFVLNCVHLGEV